MNPRATAILLSLAVAPGILYSQTDISPSATDVAKASRIYSPFVGRRVNDSTFAEGVYWGDTHLHTRFSSDSGMIGNRLGPVVAASNLGHKASQRVGDGGVSQLFDERMNRRNWNDV